MAKSLLSTCLCMMLFCCIVQSQSWSEHQLKNGMSVPCQVDSPKYDSDLDNFLRVLGSSYSDMYIKLINKKTKEVIRQVFVKAGSSYNIRNIPQEEYFVKIAYGKHPETDSNCQFRFREPAGYEQPDHVFDYHNRLASRGLVIPCYELNLRRSEQEEMRYAQSNSSDIGFN